MRSANKKSIAGGLVFLTLVAVAAVLYTVGKVQDISLPAWQAGKIMPDLFSGNEISEHNSDYYITIKDDQGRVISLAARGVSPGDEIITDEGRHYRVEKVQGRQATAKYLGADKQFLAYQEMFEQMALPVAAAPGNAGKLVGIYHTHSDESYVPSDGKEAIPFKGGIYQVGQSLVNRLKNERLRVYYDRTPHDPHDNNAYHRSRRTAARLMKQNPIALLDIHRDGIPNANYYRKNIRQEQVAQLRLVVGRQNPHMQANLDFARKMMAYANKVHPKIVKEIFMAKGNYNQDLMPTALLIEAGTHLNTKEEAERGVALFADAIPAVLGATAGPSGNVGAPRPATTPGTWRSLIWLVVLAVLGGGAFLLISTGSFGAAGNRLRGFFSRELTGFLGPLFRRRNNRKNQ